MASDEAGCAGPDAEVTVMSSVEVSVRQAPIVPLFLLALLSCAPAGDPGARFSDVFTGQAGDWVDLTHDFSEETIYWPTAESFELDEVAYGEADGGYFYAAYAFSAAEHGGTHLDAPVHFARGRATTEALELNRLIGPAVVVDVSRDASTNPDYRVRTADLRAWEERHGTIPDGALVLLRTGWSERWPDRERYLGTEATGPEAVAELHFPGLHPDAARWLVENRSVAAVGIDTPSIDFGQSSEFMAHRILYEAGIPGFENVARLEALPSRGAFVVALPMKIRDGSGGPLRIVAFIPSGVAAGGP